MGHPAGPGEAEIGPERWPAQNCLGVLIGRVVEGGGPSMPWTRLVPWGRRRPALTTPTRSSGTSGPRW